MATHIIKKGTFKERHPVDQGPFLKQRIAPRILRTSRQIWDQHIYTMENSIRPQVKIVIDAYGKPSLFARDQKTPIDKIILGNQYEHKSLWLHFDLSQLMWNDEILGEIEGEPQYALYEFRINFYNTKTNESFSWEFDGSDFQVPKTITQIAGKYKMALSIQEIFQDNFEGNIPDEDFDSRETFISDYWSGEVKASFFKPELLENIKIFDDTSQKISLIKPPINCYLSNDGFFKFEDDNDLKIGVYNDNYIRYLKFNPGNITTLIKDFNIYAIFNQKELYALNIFEEPTNAEFDDMDRPLIAWIPTEVYNSIGKWGLIIVAVSKNYVTDDELNPNYTDEFYRFISDPIWTSVKQGYIEDQTLEEKADEEYFSSNFLSEDESVLISSDNAIFNNGKNDIK